MKSKSAIVLGCLMICAFAWLAKTGQAQELDSESSTPPLNFKAELAYVSKYVWRGLTLNPDPALQPSITVSHQIGLSYNLWASMDTTSVGEDIGYGDRAGSFTEIDHTLSHCFAAGVASVTVGLVHYTFPNTGFASTSEIFVSAAFAGNLSPVLGVNYDLDEAEGAYVSAAFSRELSLGDTRKGFETLNISGRIGYGTSDYNKFYFGVDKKAFVDLLVSASAPIKINNKFSIIPSLSYSAVLDRNLRRNVSRPNQFIGGLTLSFAF
ncbi:MAG: hypothetical protein N3B12_08915 [Armatimonadetes bacterium]|nr:hypothetical protein [Armatimonadota bacterium]